MPQEASPSVLYGCVTHGPMWVAYPGFVTTICLGEAQAEGRHNLRDLAPEWVPHHPVLGGTAGSFALKGLLLKTHPRPQLVGICQYRKFVARERVSRVRAKGYKVMDVVPKDALSTQRLDALLRPRDAGFVLCPPVSLAREDGYLGQYAAHHHAEDLLRFTAEAVAQGVLSSREASAFLREPVLIPGGIELGVFPAAFWLEAITALENVVRACVQRYPVSHEGTQARAWSYCAERFGSHLLLRHFRQLGLDRSFLGLPAPWRRRYVGSMNLIVEGDGRRYHVGQ